MSLGQLRQVVPTPTVQPFLTCVPVQAEPTLPTLPTPSLKLLKVLKKLKSKEPHSEHLYKYHSGWFLKFRFYIHFVSKEHKQKQIHGQL